MKSNNKIVNIFRSNEFKATHQRIVITQTVLRRKNHPPAEEVSDKVQGFYLPLSPSTVYSTLKILKEMNLVNELALTKHLDLILIQSQLANPKPISNIDAPFSTLVGDFLT